MKIFADGADLETMITLAEDPEIAGFTTNPTLMHRSGVNNYEAFARKVLETITTHPISFEVFADEAHEMVRQALLIASWGANVYVKIPVTNTKGESTQEVVHELSVEGVHLNVTALTTLAQVELVTAHVGHGPAHIISVFAGRIADTGRDPVPLMREALQIMSAQPQLELLWASPREVLNIKQAESIGVHIITVTHDLLAKLPGLGRDLEHVSLDTVRMFHDDARRAGFSL